MLKNVFPLNWGGTMNLRRWPWSISSASRNRNNMTTASKKASPQTHQKKEFPDAIFKREKSIYVHTLCLSVSAVALFRPQLLKALSRARCMPFLPHGTQSRNPLFSIHSIIKMRPSHEISAYYTRLKIFCRAVAAVNYFV